MQEPRRPQRTYEHLRIQSSVRGAIIGYGVAAYAFIVPPTEGPFALSGRTMLLIGIGLQVLVFSGRVLAGRFGRRRLTSQEISPLVVFLLELIADGVTVLLFVLATYGPLVQFAD